MIKTLFQSEIVDTRQARYCSTDNNRKQQYSLTDEQLSLKSQQIILTKKNNIKCTEAFSKASRSERMTLIHPKPCQTHSFIHVHVRPTMTSVVVLEESPHPRGSSRTKITSPCPQALSPFPWTTNPRKLSRT